jgi:hypothetical protein
MRSRDVAELFAEIGTGARVLVTPAPLSAALVEKPATARTGDAAF